MQSSRLEKDLLSRSHGGLDVQDLHVLPVLLEKGHQKVGGQLDVQSNIARSHGDVGNTQRHAHNLLHLELDGSFGGFNLLGKRVVLIKDGREFTSLGQTRTKDSRNLLDQGSRGQKVIVLLGELLDELLVLVEFLQVIDGHLVNAHLVGSLTVLLVTNNADGGVQLWDDWKSESSRETFVSGRIIVLQSDLKFNGLSELSDLALDRLTVDGNGLALGKCQDICY